MMGPKERVHQDCLDENEENIRKLLKEKQNACLELQNDSSSTSKHDHFKHFQRQAQAALRKMQNEWWEREVQNVQQYAIAKNSNILFSPIKAILYGTAKPCITLILSADGTTLLKEKINITEPSREHFSTLLNRPSTVNFSSLNQICHKPSIECLDLLPTMEEVQKQSSRPALAEPLG